MVLAPGSVRDATFEHDGVIWMAQPGATSTFDELLTARATFRGIYTDARWNPWAEQERAEELKHAMEAMDEWTRADPGFRPLTKLQLGAYLTKVDREFEAEQAVELARREKAREHYDPERESARLSLLEQESILAHKRVELEAFRSGELSIGKCIRVTPEAIECARVTSICSKESVVRGGPTR